MSDSPRSELDPFREWDAAYLLGSLSTDERRLFERHVTTCSACSAGVSELAGIPGFLAKISAQDALAIAGSPTSGEVLSELPSLQNLAQVAIAQRLSVRRRIGSAMAVAAAFLIVIGISIGTTLQGSGTSTSSAFTTITPGSLVTMHPLQAHAMNVVMRVAEKKWGTQFQWSCTYKEVRTATENPESYDLVVTDSSGAKIVVATWREIGKQATGLVAATSIPLEDVRSLEIRTTGKLDPILQGQI